MGAKSGSEKKVDDVAPSMVDNRSSQIVVCTRNAKMMMMMVMGDDDFGDEMNTVVGGKEGRAYFLLRPF